MDTIGGYLKKARLFNRMDYRGLEKLTKIKASFIKNIEDERWDKLPEYPVVSGFVKNIASYLGLDTKKTLAIFRRDYPPKFIRLNPKPDVDKKFILSPKIAFAVGSALILTSIFVYLFFQYRNFVNPPSLEIYSPTSDQLVKEELAVVEGITDKDATVLVNQQPAIVDENGKFSEEIILDTSTTEIVVSAKSRAGKETEVRIPVRVEF